MISAASVAAQAVVPVVPELIQQLRVYLGEAFPQNKSAINQLLTMPGVTVLACHQKGGIVGAAVVERGSRSLQLNYYSTVVPY